MGEGREDYCRIKSESIQKVVANGESYEDNPVLFETSVNFFTFFKYKLLFNNQNSVLETKNNIAISKDLAIKYFGTALPVGEIITLTIGVTKSDYIITGVFEKPLMNTQLSFDMVTYEKESESFCSNDSGQLVFCASFIRGRCRTRRAG